MLDSVPGIPYLFDAEGRLVRWNKKQEEMTGYSADELAHMHVTDWFRGEDVGYIAARMAESARRRLRGRGGHAGHQGRDADSFLLHGSRG